MESKAGARVTARDPNELVTGLSLDVSEQAVSGLTIPTPARNAAGSVL